MNIITSLNIAYYKFKYPEYLDFKKHPDFDKECYICNDVCFVPDYIIEEIDNENIEFEGIIFNINNKLERGKKVLFEDENGNRWIDICISKGGMGLPPLFKSEKLPLSGFIVGVE